MKIYLTHGSHFNVPGMPTKAFASRKEANADAARLVEHLKNDAVAVWNESATEEDREIAERLALWGHLKEANAENWRAILASVQVLRVIYGDGGYDEQIPDLVKHRDGELVEGLEPDCDVWIEELELVETPEIFTGSPPCAVFAGGNSVMLGDLKEDRGGLSQYFAKGFSPENIPPSIEDRNQAEGRTGFVSPSGSPIVAIEQEAQSVWGVTFDEAGEYAYDDPPESTDWESVVLGTDLLMIDENGEGWLERHMIPAGHDLPEPEVVEAMAKAKRDAERRELLMKIARSYNDVPEADPDHSPDDALFWFHLADKMFPEAS